MNIRIITASAGTGKTTRLANLLEETLRGGAARPEAILATTFTKQAAEELLNRARTRLLRGGQGTAAQAILAARIGTVNAVCGALVTEFAFELGLSPELRVLDEEGAELALERALALVVTDEDSNRLQAFRGKFDKSFDWQYELQRLIEAARSNGLDAAGVAASAQRSVASLDECLGPVARSAEDLDAGLHSAISTALAAIRGGADTTVGTREYCEDLSAARRDLERSQLRWGDWAKLTTSDPKKKSLAHAVPVKAAAARHLAHPRLREDLHELIALMFNLASRTLDEYQDLKRAQGLLDFVDQEVLALDLLSRPAVRARLGDELDLVLVDEFQDTSPLQLAIFLKLADCARSSVWVGDPKQAIYGFRGTDPALMDAAIESLSTPTRDGDLIAAAVDAVSHRAPVETLSNSYRSRPALVAVTNAIFGRAFAQQQGMPEERVRVEPERKEPSGLELGPVIGYWPLSPTPNNADTLAAGVAAGVRDLLSAQPNVCDRDGDTARSATAKDVAILCRTNKQCREVSEALGQLGVASMVERMGLLETAEAQVLVAGLQLWVDPRDRLAAATLVRILEDPEDASAFVEKVLAQDSAERLARNPTVGAVSEARDRMPDLDVVAVVASVIDATDLRRLCAAWGEQPQRTANVDALLGHAVRYSDQRRASGDAPSLVGFLAHLGDLAAPPTLGGWGATRADTMARLEATDAVTVSTWHGAKGLEWPIVVLFGLESVREPVAYGVHVLSDSRTFDVADPLGGRRIHFWPNPYTNSVQKGPVRDAYAASDAHAFVSRQAEREALRVLYVGWTRARDRLILAARRGKLLEGLLATLTRIEPGLIGEPDGTRETMVDANWAGHAFQVQVTPQAPAPPTSPFASTPAVPGDLRTGRSPVAFPRASWAPSSAPPRPGRLGAPVRLGAPLRMRRTVEVDALGDAVHAFFASDGPDRANSERLTRAAGLLDRHRISGALEPADLLELGDRLWRWVHDQFGGSSVIRTEWPLGLVMDGGTRVLGTSDLVIEAGTHTAVVDHKSLGLTAATSKVDILKGQLGCYADAVARAKPANTVSTWLHLPFEGVVVEVS